MRNKQEGTTLENIIEVRNLTKIYPPPKGGVPIPAVDSLDFSVREGEVFGFLGPNGAGKTTTIRMLNGLTRPSSGSASILGMNIEKNLSGVKKKIGVVPDLSNLYDELTAYDNLVFDMQLYGVPRHERSARAEALLERFGLAEKRNAPFAKLSRGMKRALTIAAALAHDPILVFLDEPTTGLDVMSARRLRKTIAGLRTQGVTVFLTTHYLEEAERLCDRIGVIVRGRLVALDSVEGLKNQAKVAGGFRVEVAWKNPQSETITSTAEARTVDEATRKALAVAGGGEILSIKSIQPTLEDVFVKLTGLDAEVMLSEKGGGKGKENAGG